VSPAGAYTEISYGPVDEAVDVSPDGSLITYSKTNLDYSAPYDVWVRPSVAGPGNGTDTIEVAGNAYQSAFSPTGQQLVYVSDDGGSQIWRADLDGTGRVAVTTGPGNKQDPDWGTPPAVPTGPKCAGLTVTVDLGAGQKPTARADVILGTAGNDTINAAGGDDVVCALGGDDVVQGGPGDDRIDGGAGADTASYAAATAPVTLLLGSTAPQATGASTGTDTLRAFERAWGGSGNDRLTGTGAVNRLEGRNGDDTLLGAAGDDALIGGAGTDTCNGGDGTDTAATCETKVKIP
jgi:Ca2+-binding RTX toxin-like protein